MAALAFIEYFKQYSNDPRFDFKSFRNDILLSITPKKHEISTNAISEKTISQLRDAIISNLGQNPFFWKKNFKAQDLISIYDILVETNELKANDNQLAKLVFLLHLSKADIDVETEWIDILTSIDTIELNYLEVNEIINELSKLFDSLKTNTIVFSILNKTIQAITGRKENINFNLNKLVLHFFSSDIEGAYGFAGFNSIYISQNELLSMHTKLTDRKIDQIKTLLILKLRFFALFIHEACHVVLRNYLDDFNLSSPKLSDKGCQGNIPEAGLFAEKMVFGNRINWLKSAKNCNFEWCNQYLNGLLNGENVVFDLNNSGCVVSNKKFYNMAIDYEIPATIFE